MRVLFLDDNAERIEKAYEVFEDDDVEVVVSSWSAIGALENSEGWDLVMLDHDLGGDDLSESGMTVVDWIVHYKPRVKRFVIHSWNTVAGPIMVAELTKAGYDAEYKPFDGDNVWLAG